jgi:hypothetical protein
VRNTTGRSMRGLLLAVIMLPLAEGAVAQQAVPAACGCQSDSGVVWAEVAMSGENIAALRRVLAATGPSIQGRVLTFANRCADATHCADRDWKELPPGAFKLKVTGHVGSPGLFDGDRLRAEVLTANATLSLSGQPQ